MTQAHAFGSYVLETPALLLRRGQEVLNLPPRQIETLALIVQAQGQLVAKEIFFERVWKGAYVEEANLTQTIFLLRRALGKLPDGSDYIETLPRLGYRLTSSALDCSSQTDLQETRDERTPGSPAQGEGIGTSPVDEPLPVIATNSPGTAQMPLQAPPSLPSHFETSIGFNWRNASLLVFLILLVPLLWVMLRDSQAPSVVRSVRLTSDGAYKEILAPLLLNGTRIYFTEIIDNANYLAEVSQLGGIVTRHPMPVEGATAAAASTFQDGIVLSSTWEGTSDGGLVIRAPATDVSRVISSLGVHAAAWSPDGQQLAFTRGSALMLSDASGNNVRELAKLPDVPFWPSWSPDGHRIRFSRHGGGLDQSLWEIGAAGGSARPVLPSGPHSHDACCGSWSADGRYFIYVVDTGVHSSLWVRREHFLPEFGRRSNEFVLADGPLDFWRAPLSSSNNHHIYAQGEQALGELERYNSEAHTFEKAYGGLSADTISFSRDGQWMAYSLFPEGTIWRSRVDGSEKQQLTTPGELARFPQWAPDGRRIACIAARAGQPWTIQIIAKDGGERTIVPGNGRSQGMATFSPDGQRIAFGDVPVYGVHVGQPSGITLVDLKTGKRTTIPGSAQFWAARWSPDGKLLAATTLDRKKLMLYNFEARQWSELASLTVNDLVWSKGGDALYFDSTNGHEAMIYKVSTRTRRVEAIASLPNVQRTGFSGWRMSLSPSDEVLILRQKGFVELYRLDVNLP